MKWIQTTFRGLFSKIMQYSRIIISLICLGHLFLTVGCDSPSVNPPLIYSFSPISGKVDIVDTIKGANFTDEAIVKINGFKCPILSSSPTQLIIKVVPGVSSGVVTVTIGQLATLSHKDFHLIPHKLDTISPHSGAIGDVLKFSGLYFCEIGDSIKVKMDTLGTAFHVTDYILKGDSASFSATIPAGTNPGKRRINVTIGKITVFDEYLFDVVK